MLRVLTLLSDACLLSLGSADAPQRLLMSDPEGTKMTTMDIPRCPSTTPLAFDVPVSHRAPVTSS